LKLQRAETESPPLVGNQVLPEVIIIDSDSSPDEFFTPKNSPTDPTQHQEVEIPEDFLHQPIKPENSPATEDSDEFTPYLPPNSPQIDEPEEEASPENNNPAQESPAYQPSDAPTSSDDDLLVEVEPRIHIQNIVFPHRYMTRSRPFPEASDRPPFRNVVRPTPARRMTTIDGNRPVQQERRPSMLAMYGAQFLVHSPSQPHRYAAACRFCPKSFPSKNKLKDHMAVKHGEIERAFPCLCEALHPTSDTRNYHVKLMYTTKWAETQEIFRELGRGQHGIPERPYDVIHFTEADRYRLVHGRAVQGQLQRIAMALGRRDEDLQSRPLKRPRKSPPSGGPPPKK